MPDMQQQIDYWHKGAEEDWQEEVYLWLIQQLSNPSNGTCARR
jgi:hypothetical protein